MDQFERDELLIRLDERVEFMHERFVSLNQTATSEKGFTRCQVHRNEVEALSKSMGRIRKSLWGIIVAILTAAGINYFVR